jgi:hypothetical protein
MQASWAEKGTSSPQPSNLPPHSTDVRTGTGHCSKQEIRKAGRLSHVRSETAAAQLTPLTATLGAQKGEWSGREQERQVWAPGNACP